MNFLEFFKVFIVFDDFHYKVILVFIDLVEFAWDMLENCIFLRHNNEK